MKPQVIQVVARDPPLSWLIRSNPIPTTITLNLTLTLSDKGLALWSNFPITPSARFLKTYDRFTCKWTSIIDQLINTIKNAKLTKTETKGLVGVELYHRSLPAYVTIPGIQDEKDPALVCRHRFGNGTKQLQSTVEFQCWQLQYLL